MVRRTIVAAGVGVLLVACAVGAVGTGRSTVDVETFNAEGRTEIEVSVADWHSSAGLEEALIILHCSCLQGDREATTRADGTFTFRNLPPGNYKVQVLRYLVDVERRVRVEAGQRGRVKFRFVPGERFRVG